MEIVTKETVQQKIAILLKDFSAHEQALLDKLTLEERIEIGHPVKDVHHLSEFTADGHKFIVRTSLPVTRFEEMENLQHKVQFGRDTQQIFNNLKKTWGYLNSNEPAEAAVVVHNTMYGLKDHLDKRENEVLLLCALFVCYEGEDMAVFDLELNRRKIQAWRNEGISMESFFSLAFSLANGFTPTLNGNFRGTSSSPTTDEENQQRKKA